MTFPPWTARLAFRGRKTGGAVLRPHSFKYERTNCSCKSSSQSRTVRETRSLTLPPPRDQVRRREPGLRGIVEGSNPRVPPCGAIKEKALLECHAVQKPLGGARQSEPGLRDSASSVRSSTFVNHGCTSRKAMKLSGSSKHSVEPWLQGEMQDGVQPDEYPLPIGEFFEKKLGICFRGFSVVGEAHAQLDFAPSFTGVFKTHRDESLDNFAKVFDVIEILRFLSQVAIPVSKVLQILVRSPDLFRSHA